MMKRECRDCGCLWEGPRGEWMCTMKESCLRDIYECSKSIYGEQEILTA